MAFVDIQKSCKNFKIFVDIYIKLLYNIIKLRTTADNKWD